MCFNAWKIKMRFLRFARFLSLPNFEKTGQSPYRGFARFLPSFFRLENWANAFFTVCPVFYNVENWAKSIFGVCPVFLALKTGQMRFLRFAQFLSLPSFEHYTVFGEKRRFTWFLIEKCHLRCF